MVDESQSVLVLMSSKKGYEENLFSLRRNVIAEILDVVAQSCPTLKTLEFIVDPERLVYLIDSWPSTQRTVYVVADVINSIRSGRDFVNSEHCAGDRRILKEMSVSELLTNEDITDITQLSILGGRDYTEFIATVYNEDYTAAADPLKLEHTLSLSGIEGNHASNGNDDARELSLSRNDGKITTSADPREFTHSMRLLQLCPSENDGKLRMPEPDATETFTTSHDMPELDHSRNTNGMLQEDKALDIKDLDNVLSRVLAFFKSIQFPLHQWKDFGLLLGFDESELEYIDYNCSGDPHRCLKQCLISWLNGGRGRNDRLSWSILTNILSIIEEYNFPEHYK
jgi:hypothetical protein